MILKPIQIQDGHVELLDQKEIPKEMVYREIRTSEQMISAIQDMTVRGAPAIAISGCLGVWLESLSWAQFPEDTIWKDIVHKVHESRPTAVNLKRALDGLSVVFEKKKALATSNQSEKLQNLQESILEYCKVLMDLDLSSNTKLSQNAIPLFGNPRRIEVITHCNTGALATSGHGTALGVIRTLRDSGFEVVVYADETRPYLQGSRLTAFEMEKEGIECYIISDNMSGWVLQNKNIAAVIVGCDRIARNGDTANKIGTYPLSVLAKTHGVPFYVCATKDSFDLNLENGSAIPIEMRNPDEVTKFSVWKKKNGEYLLEEGVASPKNAKALNPSFDITPHQNIQAIITELGLIQPVTEKNILSILNSGLELKTDLQ